jgi:hypothetical protein
MRKTAKVTAKKMLSSYMGRATPNGMDPREAARLSVKVWASFIIISFGPCENKVYPPAASMLLRVPSGAFRVMNE